MSERPLPVVRVALGDHFSKIQAQSDYDFDREVISEIDLIGVTSPVVFEYARPGSGFRLPPSLFVSIDLDDGHAAEVNVSPHTERLTLEEALTLLDRLGQTFNAAGWERVVAEDASPDFLRRVFADPETEDDYSAEAGTWRSADEEIYVTLERHGRGGAAAAGGDLFVLTVNIEDIAADSDEED